MGIDNPPHCHARLEQRLCKSAYPNRGVEAPLLPEGTRGSKWSEITVKAVPAPVGPPEPPSQKVPSLAPLCDFEHPNDTAPGGLQSLGCSNVVIELASMLTPTPPCLQSHHCSHRGRLLCSFRIHHIVGGWPHCPTHPPRNPISANQRPPIFSVFICRINSKNHYGFAPRSLGSAFFNGSSWVTI